MLREKTALDDFHHPFIVALHATYQDPEHLYFLLDLAQGGELFRVMEQLDKLQEPMARFYTGSLTLALQHIHSREYVYRDLKPENVVIDSRGFIKLCDFGFAKRVVHRTFTQCGTPDYVAPEMLMGQGINSAADWWALGVLLYEMVYGFPPFTDKDGNEMKTFANILKGELAFPRSFQISRQAKDLLHGLLRVKVSARLGHAKGGAEDIIAHPWFSGAEFDWIGLVNLTLEVPWKPRLRTSDDTRFFGHDVEREFADQASSTGDVVPQEEYSNWAHVWEAFSE